MIRFYRTPWFTRLWYSGAVFEIPSQDTIYLTFDDGPNPGITPWILSELEKFQAKATFFCVGKNLEAHPVVGKDIIRKGHQVGNHTYSHMNGWKVRSSVYVKDVKLGDEVLKESGIDHALFRPPYGRIKKKQVTALDRRIIFWSHLSWDFDQRININKTISRMKKAKPGSILLFHDSEKAFSNLKIILPEILTHFHSKGYKFEAIHV